MLDFLNFLRRSLKNMNRLSRTYIKIGNVLIFSAAAAAVFCRILLGRAGIYDNMLILSDELIQLTKNLTEAFYVPALIVEIAVLAYKTDYKGMI